MRYFKKHPNVMSAPIGNGVTDDNKTVYPGSTWNDESVYLDLLERGFLIEVDEQGNVIGGAPVIEPDPAKDIVDQILDNEDLTEKIAGADPNYKEPEPGDNEGTKRKRPRMQ